MTDDQQRAREFLAQEYERRGLHQSARDIRTNRMDEHLGWVREANMAIAAIIAALRAAPEVPATHYHCAEGIHGTLKRLRRYATTGLNKNSLQGQTMDEAAEFIAHMLAARPQGVKE
jgi:hypothetical protein